MSAGGWTIDQLILDWLKENSEVALVVVPVIAFLEACVGIGIFVSLRAYMSSCPVDAGFCPPAQGVQFIDSVLDQKALDRGGLEGVYIAEAVSVDPDGFSDFEFNGLCAGPV